MSTTRMEEKALAILDRVDAAVKMASQTSPGLNIFVSPPTHQATGILATLLSNHGRFNAQRKATVLFGESSEAKPSSHDLHTVTTSSSTLTPFNTKRKDGPTTAGGVPQAMVPQTLGFQPKRRRRTRAEIIAKAKELDELAKSRDVAAPPMQPQPPSLPKLSSTTNAPGNDMAAANNTRKNSMRHGNAKTSGSVYDSRRALFRCPSCMKEFTESTDLLTHARARLCGRTTPNSTALPIPLPTMATLAKNNHLASAAATSLGASTGLKGSGSGGAGVGGGGGGGTTGILSYAAPFPHARAMPSPVREAFSMPRKKLAAAGAAQMARAVNAAAMQHQQRSLGGGAEGAMKTKGGGVGGGVRRENMSMVTASAGKARVMV